MSAWCKKEHGRGQKFNMKKRPKNKKYLLSTETIKAIEELCCVLKPIYLEMKKAGYELQDGIMTKPKQHENNQATDNR